MGLTEYVLLSLVILVPLVIATAVTAWSLEQVRLRSKKNRRRRPGREPGSPPSPSS